jgi:hypothetical protein
MPPPAESSSFSSEAEVAAAPAASEVADELSASVAEADASVVYWDISYRIISSLSSLNLLWAQPFQLRQWE